MNILTPGASATNCFERLVFQIYARILFLEEYKLSHKNSTHLFTLFPVDTGMKQIVSQTYNWSAIKNIWHCVEIYTVESNSPVP